MPRGFLLGRLSEEPHQAGDDLLIRDVLDEPRGGLLVGRPHLEELPEQPDQSRRDPSVGGPGAESSPTILRGLERFFELGRIGHVLDARDLAIAASESRAAAVRIGRPGSGTTW